MKEKLKVHDGDTPGKTFELKLEYPKPKVAAMSELKCPFCNSELHKDSNGYYTCYTDNCGCMAFGGNGASGSESLWLALIRTRKALEIAVDALKYANKCIKGGCVDWETEIDKAIKQITALEQKE